MMRALRRNDAISWSAYLSQSGVIGLKKPRFTHVRIPQRMDV
jgi:hypothetical protein